MPIPSSKIHWFRHLYLLLWGGLLEVLATILVLTWRAFNLLRQGLFGRRRELNGPVNEDGKAPILLLHGLNMDDSIFWRLRSDLKRRGYGPIYTLHFGPLSWTLEENAKMLTKTIADLAAKHGPLHLIAHSMGGLICRYCIQQLGVEKNVRSLTTLATPHFGTPMAHYGFSVPARQMKPKSEFLQRLNHAARVFPQAIRTLYLYSNLDIIVPGKWGGPVESTNIGNFCFIPYHGHNRIFLSSQVFRLIDEHLSESLKLT